MIGAMLPLLSRIDAASLIKGGMAKSRSFPLCISAILDAQDSLIMDAVSARSWTAWGHASPGLKATQSSMINLKRSVAAPVLRPVLGFD